jgi:hypothetical protein
MSTTNRNEAFTDAPPILSNGLRLRPLDSVIFPLIQSAGAKMNDDGNPAWVGLYVIAASKPPFEAGKILTSPDVAAHAYAEFLGLSEHDAEAVLAYMNRVIDRRNASQVEVEETTPGKQESHQETAQANPQEQST